MEDVPVHGPALGIGIILLLDTKLLDLQAPEEPARLRLGLVAAVRERSPGVAVTEELAGESPARADRGEDAGPDSGEVVRLAERKGVTRVDEVGRRPAGGFERRKVRF